MGCADGSLKVKELKLGKPSQTLGHHTAMINALAVTSDSQLVVSGSYDGTLKIWDLKMCQEVKTIVGHTKPIYALAITSDDQEILSGSEDRTLKVWNLKTGKNVNTTQGRTLWVSAVATTRERKVVLGLDNGNLVVWEQFNADEHKPKELIRTLKGHTSRINALAIISTPDGQIAISGSKDGILKTWDLNSGKELHTLWGHLGWVSAIAVTSDGKKIVSGSEDKTIKIWDLEQGIELATFKREFPITSFSVYRNGDTDKIITNEEDGKVRSLIDINEVYEVGGSGGIAFNHQKKDCVKTLKAQYSWFRSDEKEAVPEKAIVWIECEFFNGEVEEEGKIAEDEETKTFSFAHDEFCEEITISLIVAKKSGPNGIDLTLVHSINIRTNKGNEFLVGESSSYELNLKNRGYIIGIKGRSGLAIDKLGFHLRETK